MLAVRVPRSAKRVTKLWVVMDDMVGVGRRVSNVFPLDGRADPPVFAGGFTLKALRPLSGQVAFFKPSLGRGGLAGWSCTGSESRLRIQKRDDPLL